MQKQIGFITIFTMLTLSHCFHVPTEHFLVGQRGGINIINMAHRCDMDRLIDPMDSVPIRGSELDSRGFSLMNWNMLKGRRKGWEKDFRRLSISTDLVIIQEAYLTEDLRELLQKREYNWDLAMAFEYRDIETGVLTASKTEPSYICTFRVEEPLINLPKTVLITRYPLSKTSRSLLVANVHSINFTLGISDFFSQWLHLEQILSKHQGPLIISGDFNTWSDERMAIVEKITNRLKMKAVTFDENNRVTVFGHNIDHIYYRGLEPGEALTPTVTTSDHNPMLVTFRLADGQRKTISAR
jgi:endonuclease/exonuclease/phosphatase (EEP) superfamily protein YafD